MRAYADESLAAEVALVNEAGAPELEIDQQISFDKAAVEKVVQQVQPTQVTQATEPAQPQEAAETPKNDQADKPSETSNQQLQVTAEAGDSYTTLAREMIGQYITDQKISLSNEQRVAAETFLTAAAGTPELAVGQQVTVPQDAMKAAIDQAQKLTAEQQKQWSVYSTTVAF